MNKYENVTEELKKYPCLFDKADKGYKYEKMWKNSLDSNMRKVGNRSESCWSNMGRFLKNPFQREE